MKRGKQMRGLTSAAKVAGVEVFHAGTKIEKGRLVNAGGRVLGITAVGKDLQTAIKRAYRGVAEISWTGCYFRTDIGAKALNRLEKGVAVPQVRHSHGEWIQTYPSCALLQIFSKR